VLRVSRVCSLSLIRPCSRSSLRAARRSEASDGGCSRPDVTEVHVSAMPQRVSRSRSQAQATPNPLLEQKPDGPGFDSRSTPPLSGAVLRSRRAAKGSRLGTPQPTFRLASRPSRQSAKPSLYADPRRFCNGDNVNRTDLCLSGIASSDNVHAQRGQGRCPVHAMTAGLLQQSPA
jgi:hypothetical protein